MSTLIIDSDHNGDLLHTSEFVLDVLYPSNDGHLSEWSSEEGIDLDFDMTEHPTPKAPPPSPQTKPTPDMFFPQQLNLSLEAYMINDSNLETNTTTTETNATFSEQWAQSLTTKLLRSTIRNSKRSPFKRSCKQKMIAPLRSTSTNENSSWQTKAKIQKIENMAKATRHFENLKTVSFNSPHSIAEEEMINELRDMGL